MLMTQPIKHLRSSDSPGTAVKPSTTWPAVLLFVAISLCLAAIEQLLAVPLLPPASAKIIVALSAATIGMAAYCLLSPTSTPKNYILVATPYLFVTIGFLCSAEIPTWDTHNNHFPFFQYVAKSIAEHAQIPSWLPISGGIDFGIYHINYFPFLPHRLAGYLLVALFPISVVAAYKIQMLIGVLLFSFGWYAVISQLTRSQYAAFWGTLCVLMGGTGITLHQEQIIASCHLLPWFTYCILKSSERPAYVLPASAILGIGLSSHYPQIQLIAMSLAALAVLLLQRRSFSTVLPRMKKLLPLMGVLFILGSLPSLYVWHYSGELASGVRGSENLRPTTYEEYIDLNQQQMSSAPPRFINQYVNPGYEGKPEYEVRGYEGKPEIDSFGMFVGRASLLLLVLAIACRPTESTPILKPTVTISLVVLAFVFLELTLGINSHIAITKFLYYVKFPFISVFRQWYHFFPFLNFCLSLLSAIGFMIVKTYCTNRPHLNYLLLLVIFLNVCDLSYYDYSYLQLFAKDTPPAPLQNSFIATSNDLTTFMYKDRFQLNRDCSHAIPTSAFITTNYLNINRGIDQERALACEAVNQQAVVTNIQEHLTPEPNSPRAVLNMMSGKLHPREISYTVLAPLPALFVSELNYSLGSQAFVDGKHVQTWRVNGALSGLLLNQGQHSITFKKSAPLYIIIVCIQTLLYIGIIWILAFFAVKKTTACFVTDFKPGSQAMTPERNWN